MERSERSETIPNSSLLENEINSRPNVPQLNRGRISNARNKRGNDYFSNGSHTTEESTEIEDHDDYDTDQQSPDNSGIVCGLCHLPPGVTRIPGVSTGPGQMLTCTQGHLLCQQCVHRYTVCSDVGCVVCGADIYASTSSLNPRGAEAAIRNDSRRPSTPLEGGYRSRNYDNEASGVLPGNPRHCKTDYDSGDAILATKKNWNRNYQREIQAQLPHQQTRSYCSIRGGDADLEPEVLQRIPSSYARDGTGNAATAHSECSRRPIRCPRLDCAVNVAFSALTNHFLFDHPEVPILSVEPGSRSTLIVSFAALSCNSSRCLALLLVSGKLMGAAARLFNGSQIQPRYRNRLPLSVLAARLHCSNENPCDDVSHAHRKGEGRGDVVIAWVAGLDVGSSTGEMLRCSIQAVDGNDSTAELRSLTYTGPVNSLRTAQRPRQVLETGDCVILHQGFIDHITSGYASLNVNVVVH